ncbi:MAG: DUF4340 domain-containing protein [Deltaproteobacteria bacterium]|nr:DUF4340 domain-containing protein [Deltaproteobacteria bacterium]
MKVKKEYFILAVLILALSVYLYFRRQDRAQYELPVLEEVPVSEIMKIEISKPQGPVIALERKDEGWVLLPEKYPADKGKITAMLESLRNLTLSALISESKSYERYGLGKEDKIAVKAWTEKGLKRDFEIGKEAPSFQHTFVKIGGDARVFHARQNLKIRFGQSVEDLRDKTVLVVNLSELEAIELHDGKTSVRLIRKEGSGGEAADQASWESPEGSVDDTTLSELLSTLSNLKCSAFIYDKTKDDLKDPIYTITLKGLENHSLTLFAKDEKNRNDNPAISSQKDSPFLLSGHQADRIMLNLERVVKKP